MLTRTEQARILIAVDLHRNGHVLATDSDWVAFEVDEIGTSVADLGLELPGTVEAGVYLWDGTLQADGGDSTWMGTTDPTTVYRGAATRVYEGLSDLLIILVPPSAGAEEAPPC